MLNLFNSKSEVNIPTEQGPDNSSARELSEARKKLRWMINSTTEFVQITPAMALVMLERNADDEWRNRPQSGHGLTRYIKAMRAGWKKTGEPIIFSVSGKLLNGQHRLVACIKADAPFWTTLVFGVDDDAFKFMDIGIARTAGHIFAIENIPNSNVAAASARLLYGYMGSAKWEGRTPEVENSNLLEFYERHDRLQESLPYARQLYGDLRMQQRWGTFLHYVCAAKNREAANEFFEKVATGIGLTNKSSPAFTLRKRLLQNASSTSDKLGDAHIGAFCVQAWNAHRRSGTMKLFRWRTEQTANEAFPRAE